MNVVFYMVCNSCSLALVDSETPVDPAVEAKMIEAGWLAMNTGRDFISRRACDLCGTEHDRLIEWEQI